MLRTEGGHFWITFDNGYTLSCFNGFGSHTENNFVIEKQREIEKSRSPYTNSWESKLVEIAILYHGELVTQNHIVSDDSVKTVDIEELVEIINIVSNLKGDNE